MLQVIFIFLYRFCGIFKLFTYKQFSKVAFMPFLKFFFVFILFYKMKTHFLHIVIHLICNHFSTLSQPTPTSRHFTKKEVKFVINFRFHFFSLILIQALRDQARVLNSEPIVLEPIIEFQKNCEKY